MSKLNDNTIDEVTLKLSGLIGTFNLIVDLLSGDRCTDLQKNTMLDFAYFISKELQGLFKTISGVEYNS
jgi:hypothetical protein